jgi:MFS family permease
MALSLTHLAGDTSCQDPGATRPRTDLRNGAILTVFTAATNLADGVMKVALPLLATRLTSSPAQVTGVALALSLPWLLTALHVGVLVDRANRRTLLVAANAMRVSALAALTAAVAGHGVSIPLLYVAGAVLGIAEVIAITAAMALVPAAISQGGREQVNAWMTAAETVCNEFCGPFVGGLLVAAGYGVALGASGTAFLVTLVMPLLLIGQYRAAPSAGAPVPVHAKIAEGLSFLWQRPLLRTMALTLSVLCLCWGAWLALIPLVATRALHLRPQDYGLIMSALGIGGFVGAASSTWLGRRFGRRWVMFGDLVGTFAMVAAPALLASPYAIAASAFLGGMGGTLWTVTTRTLAQKMVPPDMMGRFFAAWRLFSWGALPVGAATIGALAQIVGLRAAFLPFAAATALLVVPFLKAITPSALREADST